MVKGRTPQDTREVPVYMKTKWFGNKFFLLCAVLVLSSLLAGGCGGGGGGGGSTEPPVTLEDVTVDGGDLDQGSTGEALGSDVLAEVEAAAKDIFGTAAALSGLNGTVGITTSHASATTLPETGMGCDGIACEVRDTDGMTIHVPVATVAGRTYALFARFTGQMGWQLMCYERAGAATAELLLNNVKDGGSLDFSEEAGKVLLYVCVVEVPENAAMPGILDFAVGGMWRIDPASFKGSGTRDGVPVDIVIREEQCDLSFYEYDVESLEFEFITEGSTGREVFRRIDRGFCADWIDRSGTILSGGSFLCGCTAGNGLLLRRNFQWRSSNLATVSFVDATTATVQEEGTTTSGTGNFSITYTIHRVQ